MTAIKIKQTFESLVFISMKVLKCVYLRGPELLCKLSRTSKEELAYRVMT